MKNSLTTLKTVETTASPIFPATANPTYTRNNHNNRTYHAPKNTNNQNTTPNQNPRNPFKGKCQWCNVQGHTLSYCPTFKALHPSIHIPTRPPRLNGSSPQAHTAIASSSNPPPSYPWLLDSGASHHVTTDLANLSLHYPYDGTEEIVIGDGSGLPITHTDNTRLSTSTKTFSLSNLCSFHAMHKNRISISKFCQDNHANIEFSPSFFYVKDRQTGATLLKGPTKDGVYEWPKSSSYPPQVFATIAAKSSDWHRRFGHPSQPILKLLLSSLNMSLRQNKKPCTSC